VLDAGHRQGTIHQKSDHVDTARLLLPVRLPAVRLEQHAQLSLLARIDRLFGGAETNAPPRLDLDEDEGVAILRDDVDLAEARAPVAG
jgi:hypothetical protein